MKLLLIAVVALIAVANIAIAIPAIDTTQNNQDTLVAEHKVFLANDSDDQEDNYYASEQYETAKKANQFIAKAYGRSGDE